jgi:hypothetical protein
MAAGRDLIGSIMPTRRLLDTVHAARRSWPDGVHICIVQMCSLTHDGATDCPTSSS